MRLPAVGERYRRVIRERWMVNGTPDGDYVVQFHGVFTKLEHDLSRPLKEGTCKMSQRKLINRIGWFGGVKKGWIYSCLVKWKWELMRGRHVEGEYYEPFAWYTAVEVASYQKLFHGAWVCKVVD